MSPNWDIKSNSLQSNHIKRSCFCILEKNTTSWIGTQQKCQGQGWGGVYRRALLEKNISSVWNISLSSLQFEKGKHREQRHTCHSTWSSRPGKDSIYQRSNHELQKSTTQNVTRGEIYSKSYKSGLDGRMQQHGKKAIRSPVCKLPQAMKETQQTWKKVLCGKQTQIGPSA